MHHVHQTGGVLDTIDLVQYENRGNRSVSASMDERMFVSRANTLTCTTNVTLDSESRGVELVCPSMRQAQA